MSENRIALPGSYTMPNAEYQADPVVEPSLSSGIAHTLLVASPFHAWHAHPRLNPNYEPAENSDFDYGAAVHALVLENREDAIVPIRAKDYKGGDAKAARDAARAVGKLPVLEAKLPQVFAMREALLVAIKGNPDLRGIELARGVAEEVDIWRHAGIWKRSRKDWRSHDRRVILDYKTTKGSANPDSWVRTMLGLGGDLQNVHYVEGNEAVSGIPADETKFIFAVQEQEPPHAVAFIGLPPEFINFSRAKYAEACGRWRSCTSSGDWPGYPNRVCWVEVPGWATYQWENRVPSSMVAVPGEDPSAGMESMYGDLRREKEAAGGGVH